PGPRHCSPRWIGRMAHIAAGHLAALEGPVTLVFGAADNYLNPRPGASAGRPFPARRPAPCPGRLPLAPVGPARAGGAADHPGCCQRSRGAAPMTTQAKSVPAWPAPPPVVRRILVTGDSGGIGGATAGILVLGPVEAVPPGRPRRSWKVNLFGALAVTLAFLPQMRQRGSGRIVNVSSVMGRFALPGSGHVRRTPSLEGNAHAQAERPHLRREHPRPSPAVRVQ